MKSIKTQALRADITGLRGGRASHRATKMHKAFIYQKTGALLMTTISLEIN